MRKMVCEVCRGSEFHKADGEYVCQGCGTRYLPAEALRLVVGDCRGNAADGSARQADGGEDPLDLAIKSKNAGNFFEAEYYCDKALESDGESYLAWRNKAEAVARQTTLADDRTADAIDCYREALRHAPDELRDNLRKESGDVLRSALVGRVLAACGKYGKTALMPDGVVVLGLPRFVEDRAGRLESATGAVALDDSTRDLVSAAMYWSGSTAWSERLLPAYAGDEHRDKAAMDSFVDGGDQVISIMESAIGLSPASEERTRACYELMVAVQGSLVDAHSMRLDGRRWVRAYSLSGESKEARRRDIDRWNRELERLGPGEGRQAAQPGPTQAGETRARGGQGVWHRTVTWKALVGIVCMTQFMNNVGAAAPGGRSLALVWLLLGVLFMAWWYKTG